MEERHRRRSSVNLGGKTFLPEKFVRKINKMPEFYMILARKMPEFYLFFLGGGHEPPASPVSYAYEQREYTQEL